MDGCNVGGAGIIIAFVTAYSVHFILPMITALAERLKCKCVCVRAGRLFLLPCQHSPFPPFSISSAFSLAISDWLFIDSTLYATSHAIQVELGLWGGGDGRRGGWGSHDPRGLNLFVSTLYVTATVPGGTSSVSLKSTQTSQRQKTCENCGVFLY